MAKDHSRVHHIRKRKLVGVEFSGVDRKQTGEERAQISLLYPEVHAHSARELVTGLDRCAVAMEYHHTLYLQAPFDLLNFSRLRIKDPCGCINGKKR